MKRRTLMRKLGAAGIGAAAIAGPTAGERPTAADLGVERELDVSSVDGWVTADELLEPRDLETVPDDVDPSEVWVTVAPEADVVTLGECCDYCCWPAIQPCDCDCCDCDMQAC